jgi:hypothetical protein
VTLYSPASTPNDLVFMVAKLAAGDPSGLRKASNRWRRIRVIFEFRHRFGAKYLNAGSLQLPSRTGGDPVPMPGLDVAAEGQRMVVLAELVRELKVLRKGRGLLASHIGDRIGSALRAICDVTDDDGPAVIRQKVARRLESLAGDLPADLRIAVLAAFAICPDARLPFYQDRVRWTAHRINRDPRTARRRIDAGIDHLAQLATVRPIESADHRPAPAGTGWRTVDLRVMVALDQGRPRAVELARIVAEEEWLAEVEVGVVGIELEILYGAVAARAEAGRQLAALPKPLARWEEHELGVACRLPAGAPPHVVYVPDRPCELFDLRVRFDRAHLPWRISLLRGALDRDIASPAHSGETRTADEAGEIHLVFRDLVPGLAYGARWDV